MTQPLGDPGLRHAQSGWWHAGVRDPESVAEHSLRVAQLAGLIAAEEGADPARASFLALWHDTQETRTGDLPHPATAYLTKPDPRQITADQTANLPTRSRDLIRVMCGWRAHWSYSSGSGAGPSHRRPVVMLGETFLSPRPPKAASPSPGTPQAPDAPFGYPPRHQQAPR